MSESESTFNTFRFTQIILRFKKNPPRTQLTSILSILSKWRKSTAHYLMKAYHVVTWKALFCILTFQAAGSIFSFVMSLHEVKSETFSNKWGYVSAAWLVYSYSCGTQSNAEEATGTGRVSGDHKRQS